MAKYYHIKKLFPQVACFFFQKVMNSLFQDDNWYLTRKLYNTGNR